MLRRRLATDTSSGELCAISRGFPSGEWTLSWCSLVWPSLKKFSHSACSGLPPRESERLLWKLSLALWIIECHRKVIYHQLFWSTHQYVIVHHFAHPADVFGQSVQWFSVATTAWGQLLEECLAHQFSPVSGVEFQHQCSACFLLIGNHSPSCSSQWHSQPCSHNLFVCRPSIYVTAVLKNGLEFLEICGLTIKGGWRLERLQVFCR